MNGRIYDPKIGRFLQADPIVQAPKNSQSLNRYSYVLNNPLSYTDPSGYFSLKTFARLVVAAVAVYITAGLATTWVAGWGATWGVAATATSAASLTAAGGAIVGAITGAVGGAILTGTVKGAFYGALSGAALGAIGASGLNKFGKTVASGAANGITTELQGGKFGHGFLSAGAGTLTGVKLGGSPSFGKFLSAVIAGGTISELTGGKFANGAISAGLAYVVAAAGAASSVPNDPESALGDAGDLAADQRLALAEVQEAFESGELDSSRIFGTHEAAAKEALSVVGPISRRYQVELGGFISGAKGSYSYGQIYVGTRGNLPALQNVPFGAVAGFHTHPSGSTHFSLNDAKWVNGDIATGFIGTGIPLYAGGNNQISICGVSSNWCDPVKGALVGQYDSNNRALQGSIIQ